MRVLFFGGALALYLVTASPWLQPGDNGEYVLVGSEGGIAHAPGYPLYTLYLRAFHGLPALSPAHRAAMLTAVLGAAAVGFLAAACRAWGAGRGATIIATALFAVSPLQWQQATAAEVFAGNVMVAALLLWLCAPSPPLAGARLLIALAFSAGVGLAHHQSIVALAPLGVFSAASALRASRRPALAALLSVLALALPFTSYATLFPFGRGPDHLWVSAPVVDTMSALHHFLRRDYGTFALASHAGPAQPVRELAAWAHALGDDLLWLPLIAALIGGGALRKHTRGAVLIASLLLAGPVLIARFNVDPTGFGSAIVRRFYLLPELLIALLIAIGLTHIPAYAQRASLAIAAAAVLLVAWRSAQQLDTVHTDTFERYLTDTLTLAPPRAVLIGTGDHRDYGFPYRQHLFGERRDVLFFNARFADQSRYLARMTQMNDALLPLAGTSMRQKIRFFQAQGRPVALTDPFMVELPNALNAWPEGTLMHIPAVGEHPPPLDVQVARNFAAYAALHLPPQTPSDAGWEASIDEDYARSWAMLGDAYERFGLESDAYLYRNFAQDYAPAGSCP